jgi:hypothetical protein
MSYRVLKNAVVWTPEESRKIDFVYRRNDFLGIRNQCRWNIDCYCTFTSESEQFLQLTQSCVFVGLIEPANGWERN